jgi:hypothetical protein
MKKVKIAVFVALFCLSKVHAQSISLPKEGDIILNNSLNNFIGTWRWVNGIDTITIKLKKELVLIPSFNFKWTVITGCHEYKQGNTFIESNLQYFGYAYSAGYASIFADNDRGASGNIVDGNITDLSKGKKIHSIKMVFNSSLTEMTFTISHTEGMKYNEIPGMTLPSNLTFIKLPPPPPIPV